MAAPSDTHSDFEAGQLALLGVATIAPDQPAELDHRAEASPDSLLFASRIKFATGTVVSAWSECDLGTNFDDAAGRNFEVVTRIVGYARKRDEQPILPARHARAGGRLERPAGQEERS